MTGSSLGRRAFVVQGIAAIAALTGCDDRLVLAPQVTPGSPRLSARPRDGFFLRLDPGLHRRSIGGVDVVLYLPRTAREHRRVPVLVFLHGAGRTVETFVEGHRAFADEAGVMIVAPYAMVDTWDGINGPYGRDVEALDLVLQWVFHQVPADPDAIALSGFSDGAVQALGVGRGNGDLFARVVAYSPHALIATQPVGLPPITVSHGTTDAIVPWGVSAEYIVPALRDAGHAVDFVSFTGGHAVPSQLVGDVVRALGGVAPYPALRAAPALTALG